MFESVIAAVTALVALFTTGMATQVLVAARRRGSR